MRRYLADFKPSCASKRRKIYAITYDIRNLIARFAIIVDELSVNRVGRRYFLIVFWGKIQVFESLKPIINMYNTVKNVRNNHVPRKYGESLLCPVLGGLPTQF